MVWRPMTWSKSLETYKSTGRKCCPRRTKRLIVMLASSQNIGLGNANEPVGLEVDFRR